MSRCFPYPPPGYSGNGATYEALIESIKLQKDTDKIKSERKKEKRAKKEKKEKREKRKDEKSKLQKHPNETQQELQDDHKSLQTSLHFKKTDPIDQHLERSDLTEEHGQPVDSHKPSYSSDSTQNSNKRKREDPVVPDSSNNVNKPIKIRLLKKKKGPDSIKETSSNSERRDEKNHVLVQDSRLNSSQVSSSQINGERTQLFSSNRKTQRKILPLSKIEEPISLQSKKDDMAVSHSSIQQSIPIPSFTRPSENDIPSSSQIVPPPVPQDVSSSGRKSTDEVKVSSKDKKKKEPMTRHEKKLQKKYSKYEKLIGSWVPPVLESLMSTDNDDDWLGASGKVGSARSARGDEMEVCREVTWQPCARFLVEGDVYALPYTVPF